MEKVYSYQELSKFCLQVAILQKAGVPLDEGLSIMAEDAGSKEERELLIFLAKETEMGEPIFAAIKKTKAFPSNVVQMAKLGWQTGTLDQVMEALSVYYEKEFFMMQNVKNALTYPTIMITMLLVILFVLFTKVMPIFEDVYNQLGANLSPVSLSAIRLGGILSGGALMAGMVLALAVAVIYICALSGTKLRVVETIVNCFKRKSKIALLIANRRFTAVLAVTLRIGMELSGGFELAEELVENSRIQEKLKACSARLEAGADYYDAMKSTGLFNGFHIQMIKVGDRSGCLDQVMNSISEDYEHQADISVDNMISRIEPAIVAVLAISVGLILLSVMLPLVGVLSVIG